jgi:hypothetical protein
LWFTEAGVDKIARITLKGAITEFPGPAGGSQPLGLTIGPDGNFWFTEYNVGRVGRMTTAGTFLGDFSVPVTGSKPSGITTAPDGNVWFTDYGADIIGRVTPSGSFTTFTIPTPNSVFGAITLGGDGALWFAEFGGSKIGRITLDGAITELTPPTPSSQPFGITSGPDGNLWFTEYNGNRIGQVALPLTAAGTRFSQGLGKFPLQRVATFHYADASALPTDFTAMIAWGDGSSSPGQVQEPSGPGTTFFVIGSHHYAAAGTYAVVVSIQHTADGLSAAAYSTGRVTGGAAASVALALANHATNLGGSFIEIVDSPSADGLGGRVADLSTQADELTTGAVTSSGCNARGEAVDVSDLAFLFPDGPWDWNSAMKV